jgi:hypothetical protein
MKIKLTERQLKKLTESISDENLNEGVIDFLKGGYELVKNLFKKAVMKCVSKSLNHYPSVWKIMRH